MFVLESRGMHRRPPSKSAGKLCKQNSRLVTCICNHDYPKVFSQVAKAVKSLAGDIFLLPMSPYSSPGEELPTVVRLPLGPSYPTFNIEASSTSNQVSHLYHSSRWCWIILACLHQDSHWVSLARTPLTTDVSFYWCSTHWPPPCSLARSPHLPMLYSELHPSSLPNAKSHHRVPIPINDAPTWIKSYLLCFNKYHWRKFLWH